MRKPDSDFNLATVMYIHEQGQYKSYMLFLSQR